MILNWMVLLWLKLDLCVSSVKAGIPGIKIKPSNNFDETTEYPELHAVIGSAVHLPCNLSPPSDDDAIVLVLWYRLDLPNPIYTLDTRDVPSEAKHFSSKILGSRAHFNMSRRSSAHLKINPIEGTDEGEYRCRIDYKRGRTINRLVKLNVIVPVKKVLIRGIGNTTYSGSIGPFTEGERLVLTCEAVEGRPRPFVIWRKGVNILQGSVSITDRGWVRNELVFDPLKREDLLSTLVCQAINSNLTAPVYASVTIDLNLKPLSIQLTPIPGALVAGDNFELNCQSEGSKPPAEITWMKGMENVTQLAIHNVYGSISVSSLQMQLTPDDNRKKLVCHAQNPHLPESALKESLILNVQFVPQLTLVFGASVQYEHIREGSDVYFECNIQSNPPVTDVRWKFQSHILDHAPASGVVVKNHSLLLHSVSRRHKGTYQCVAENPRGRGKSEDVPLRIQHSPYCVPRQQRTYGIVHQGRSNITCSVEADPSEVTFTWTLNGSAFRELRGASTLGTIGGAKSVIEYHPVTKTDYGSIQCYAKNAIGDMREPCVFTIVPAGPPPPLRSCVVLNQTNSSLYVSCENEDSPKPLTYHLEIYDMKGEQLVFNITSKHKPEFFAQDLPSGSTFIVALYTTSSKGRSETVALTTSTLLSSQKHTNKESSGVINGILFIALVVIGILAVFTVMAGLFVVRSKAGSSSIEATTVETEMTEKMPSSNKQSFEDGNAYVYHTSDMPKEYVHLTPKSAPDCLYESLIDGHQKNFQSVLCKSHSFQEEGIEVILPGIDR